MNAIFSDHLYQGFMIKISKNLSQLFQDTFYAWNAHLGTCKVEFIKPRCQGKTEKLFFILIID